MKANAEVLDQLSRAQQSLLECARYGLDGHSLFGPVEGIAHWAETDEGVLERRGRQWSGGTELGSEVEGRLGVVGTQREANRFFCRLWVERFWVPSVGAVRDAGATDLVERFDPGHDILRWMKELYLDVLCSGRKARSRGAELVNELTLFRDDRRVRASVLPLYFGRLAREMPVLCDLDANEELVLADPSPTDGWARLCENDLLDQASTQVEEGSWAVRWQLVSKQKVRVEKLLSGEVLSSVEVRGPTRTQVFLAVADSPGAPQSWEAIRRSLWEKGITSAFELGSLQRHGNRIRKDLGELGTYWRQSGQWASWNPPGAGKR